MGRRIGHPAAATRRAGGTSLTAERNEFFLFAGFALKPQKAEGRNPAFEKGAHFAFDKSRHPAAAATLLGEKRFEVFLNDAVDEGFFRNAG
jgi:hypothetical protein